MSSADPGAGEESTGEAPAAEEITDPALRAEVDNPAESNVPTGARAAPGDAAAADDPPLPAAGAPEELSSDQAPPQGGEEGAPAPDEGLADVAGGDAGAPESGPPGAPVDRSVPADKIESAPAPEGATVPEQPPPRATSEAEGALVAAARSDRETETETEAADHVEPAPAPEGATVPEQPPPTATSEAEGALVAAARSDRETETEAAEAGTPAGDETEPADVDAARRELVERLAGALDGGVVETHVVPGVDAWARVEVGHWHRAFEVCRDDLGLTYFDFLSAIDWLPSPYGRSEDAGEDGATPDEGEGAADGEGATPGEGTTAEEGEGAAAEGADTARAAPSELAHGVTGGTSRFQLLARLMSPTSSLGLTLKADVDDEELRAPTVSDVYPGADWHERETWEMYGIDFAGHPNLVHLYLPGAFEGHPQRKDFPLLAREVKPWPGLVDVEAMPGEQEAAAS